jgi:hypothetical protein
LSKADRIPDAWPAQMSDVLAARYCDYSLSQFQAMVKAGRIEAGKTVPGSRLTRWHRATLDRHLADIHGVDTLPGAPAKSLDETREARRAAYEASRRKHGHKAA